MDIMQAIKERRSCRQFLQEPVPEELVEKILEAATWAPSPLNLQPWEFVVITSQEVKEAIYAEAERCRQQTMEVSGWKWLEGYSPAFVKTAPVIVAVVGNPQKTGADMFQENGSRAYEHACAAAVQNMLLAAKDLGLDSLWFTFYERTQLAAILEIEVDKTPVALVCLGRSAVDLPPVPRKGFAAKTRYIR